MLRFLTKLFVISFYRNNAGFFIFFFFFFFGIVQDGSIITYHLSLIYSMLESGVVLCGIMICWFLYHLKCALYCLKIINSTEGSFLYQLQIVPVKEQAIMLFSLHLLLYAPVLIYSFIIMIVGWQTGYYEKVILIGIFQLLVSVLGATIYYRRLNNWFFKKKSLHLKFFINKPRPFPVFIIYYFSTQKKTLFLTIKLLSLALLYIVLVLNRDGYDNDSFIFFYQLILLLHSVFAFLAIEFLEKKLSFYRNLPFSLIKHAAIYIITYTLLLLPEFLYLLFNGWQVMPIKAIVFYYTMAISTLCLFTAVQYAEAMNRTEFIKVVFAVFFVSTFVLHVEAFWLWIIIQWTIAFILFRNGFYKYQSLDAI